MEKFLEEIDLGTYFKVNQFITFSQEQVGLQRGEKVKRQGAHPEVPRGQEQSLRQSFKGRGPSVSWD